MANEDVIVSLGLDLSAAEASFKKFKESLSTLSSTSIGRGAGGAGSFSAMAKDAETLQQRIDRIASSQERLRGTVAASNAEFREYERLAGVFDKIAAAQQRASNAARTLNEEMSRSQGRMTSDQNMYEDMFKYLDAQKQVTDYAARELGERESIAAVQQQINAEVREHAELTRTVAENNRFAAMELENQVRSARMIATDINRQGGVRGAAKNMVTEAGGTISMAQALEYQRGLADYAEKYGQNIRNSTTYMDRQINKFGQHVLQWTAWSVIIGGVLAGLQEIEKTVRETSEFQVQGVLQNVYARSARDQGMSVDTPNQTQLLSASIQLAQTYGEKVNDVAQDIDLWYKRTGNLNDAMAMTNETLKFQLASGASLEDVYKTLTALSVQSEGQKMGGIFGGQTFDMTKSASVLHEIYAAAVAAGGGMRQISEGEREIGGNANAASILLEALDKDNAALRSMGSSMTESIALNAALIQSFGNTQQAAGEAADRISRIAGALASLSKPGALKEFAKAGIDVKELSADLDTHQNVLFKVLQTYDKIEHSTSATRVQQEKYIETALGGRRQFEALNAIYQAYKNNLDQITKAMKDEGQEDAAAEQMRGTLKNSLDRLNATWEALELTVGVGMVGALTTFVNQIPGVVAAIHQLGGEIGNVMGGLEKIGDLQMHPWSIFTAQGRSQLGSGFGQISQGANDFFDDNQGNYVLPHGKFKNGAYTFRYGKDNQTGAIQDGKVYAMGEHGMFGMDVRSDQAQNFFRHIGVGQQFGDAKFMDKVLQGGTLNPGETWENQAFLQAFGGSGSLPDFIMKQKKFMNQFQNQDPDGNFSGGAGAAGGNKDLKDYQVAAQTLADMRDRFADVTEAKKMDEAATDSNIQHLEHLISTYGINEDYVKKLVTAHKQHQAELVDESKTLMGQKKQYDDAANSAHKHAVAVGLNTEEGKGWEQVSRQAHSASRQLQQQIMQEAGAWDQDADSIARVNAELVKDQVNKVNQVYDKRFAFDQTAAKNGTGSIDAAAADEAQRHLLVLKDLNDAKAKGKLTTDAYNQAITAETQKHDANKQAVDDEIKSLRERLDSSITSAQDSLQSDLVKMAGFNPADQKSLEGMIKLNGEMSKFNVEYQKLSTEAPGYMQPLVEQWGSLQQAAFNADAALMQYEDHMARVQASPVYQGMMNAANAIAGDASTALTNDLFGISSQQAALAGYDQTAQRLETQKTLLQDYYNMQLVHTPYEQAMEKVRLDQLDQEIAKQKALAQAEKDKLAHPSMLKKVGEDFFKSVSDSLLKNAADTFVKGFFGLDGNRQLQDALRQQALATTGTFAPAVTDWVSSNINYLVPALQNWNDTAVNLMQNGIPLYSTGGGSSGNPLLDAFNAIGSIPGGGGSWANDAGLGADASLANVLTGGSNLAWGGNGGGSALAAGAMTLGLLTRGGGGGGGGFGGFGGGGGILSFLTGGGKPTGLMGGLGIAGAGIGLGRSMGGGLMGGLTGAIGTGIGLNVALGGGMGLLGTGGLLPMLAMNPLLFGGALLIGGLLGSGMGPHLNSHDNPDIFNTQDYGQAMADMGGSGYGSAQIYTANGQQFTENSQLNQALGGQGEAGFISQWIAAHPNDASKVLTPDQLKDFTGANGQEFYGKNGMVTLGGNNVTGYWQDLTDAAKGAVQSIQDFSNTLNSASNSQGLVSLNQFGSNIGFFPFAGNTPGYEFPSNPASAPSVPGSTSGTYGSAENPPSTGRTPVTHVNVDQPINLDGRTIGRNNQAYRLRSGAGGNSRLM